MVKVSSFVYASVPPLFAGETVMILASGPSLTQADVDACRGKVRVIAVNDTYRLAPWADVLYGCDSKWWTWHHGVPAFQGLKFALERSAAVWPGVQVLKNTGVDGLETETRGLRTGKNSGYQSIGLARHFGAKRILLLGFDLKHVINKPSHFFGEHPSKARPPVETFRPFFRTLVAPLKAEGITVINCTRDTNLVCFPQQSLTVALAESRTHVAA